MSTFHIFFPVHGLTVDTQTSVPVAMGVELVGWGIPQKAFKRGRRQNQLTKSFNGASSFLRVRRQPPKTHQVTLRETPHGHFKAFMGPTATSVWRSAQTRADEVMGLLLAAFTMSTGLPPPALRHHILMEDRSYVASDGTTANIWTGDGTRTLPSQSVHADLSTVEQWLSATALTSLRKLVDTTSKRKKFQKRIVAALARLPYSVHTQQRSQQLLGAHTSLEVLLGSQTSSIVERRIGALCGKEASNYYGRIANLRHSYVHEGKPVERMKDTNLAHRLVVSTLARSSDLALEKTTDEAWKYLDVLASASSIASDFEEAQGLEETLLCHQRDMVRWTPSSGVALDAEESAWRFDSLEDGAVSFRRGEQVITLRDVPAQAVRSAHQAYRQGDNEKLARALRLATGLRIEVVMDATRSEVFVALRHEPEKQDTIVG